MVGVHPGPFKFRHLMVMAEGRERRAWDRAAVVAMLLANANRDRKKKASPFTIADFHPYLEDRPNLVDWSDLKAMFKGSA